MFHPSSSVLSSTWTTVEFNKDLFQEVVVCQIKRGVSGILVLHNDRGNSLWVLVSLLLQRVYTGERHQSTPRILLMRMDHSLQPYVDFVLSLPLSIMVYEQSSLLSRL